MPMPETTVNENGSAPLRQHNVRGSWKPPDIHTEPETLSMQSFAQQNFGFRIVAADA
ncbi:hypothetical protein SL1157_0381 [Ruegeria lacuscaerulensis ITI-1157]|nr:hypothetical protein SL1157_0381 [Ruegeria lacuscaerulensis ITI-1157]